MVYIAILAITRPFEKTEQNIVELINEIFYFLFVSIMLGLDTEEKWEGTPTKAYLALMTANSLVIALVLFSKCLIGLHSKIYSILWHQLS